MICQYLVFVFLRVSMTMESLPGCRSSYRRSGRRRNYQKHNPARRRCTNCCRNLSGQFGCLRPLRRHRRGVSCPNHSKRDLSCAILGAFLARVLAGLMAKRVEIEPPIVVLLTIWCAGAPIMKLNGKYRVIELQSGINSQERVRYGREHFFQAQ